MVTNGFLTGQPWTTQRFDPKECDGKWMVLAMSDKGKNSWNYLKHNPKNGLFEAELDLPSKNDVHIMLYCEGVNRSEDDKQMQSQYNKIKQETGNAVTDEQLDQCFAPKNMIPFGGIYFKTDYLSQSKETASIVHMREDIYCMLSSPDHFSVCVTKTEKTVNDNEKKTEMIENELTKLSDQIEAINMEDQDKKFEFMKKKWGENMANQLRQDVQQISFGEQSSQSWSQGIGLKGMPPSMYENTTNQQLNDTIHRDSVNALQGMLDSMKNRNINARDLSTKQLFLEWDRYIRIKVPTQYRYTFDETETPPPKLDPNKKVIMGDQAKAGAGYYKATLNHMRANMHTSIAAISELQKINQQFNSDALKQHLDHCLWSLTCKTFGDVNKDCEDQSDWEKALLRAFKDKDLIEREINVRTLKENTSITRVQADVSKVLNTPTESKMKNDMKFVANIIEKNINITSHGIDRGHNNFQCGVLNFASGAKLDDIPQQKETVSRAYDKSDVKEIIKLWNTQLGGHSQENELSLIDRVYDAETGVWMITMKTGNAMEGTGVVLSTCNEKKICNSLNSCMGLEVHASANDTASFEALNRVATLNKALSTMSIKGTPEEIISTMTQITTQLALKRPNVKLTQISNRAGQNFAKIFCAVNGLQCYSITKSGVRVQADVSNVTNTPTTTLQADVSNITEENAEFFVLDVKKDKKYDAIIKKLGRMFSATYANQRETDKLQNEMFSAMDRAGINTKIPNHQNTALRGTLTWEKFKVENVMADFFIQVSPFTTEQEVEESIRKSLNDSHKGFKIDVIPGEAQGLRQLVLEMRVIITS